MLPCGRFPCTKPMGAWRSSRPGSARSLPRLDLCRSSVQQGSTCTTQSRTRSQRAARHNDPRNELGTRQTFRLQHPVRLLRCLEMTSYLPTSTHRCQPCDLLLWRMASTAAPRMPRSDRILQAAAWAYARVCVLLLRTVSQMGYARKG